MESKRRGQKKAGGGKEQCGLSSCLSQSRRERFAMRKTGSSKNSCSSANSFLKTFNSRL